MSKQTKNLRKSSLSVVINTKNASKTIENAISSVLWANEIIIADMHSSDNTLELVDNFVVKNPGKISIICVDDCGYVEPARNKAIGQASNEWVLILDADEEISTSLKEKIVEILENPHKDAYFIPRKNIIFNHWIQYSGWWPDYVLRLFKKDQVEWSDAIHSIPIIKSSSQKIEAQEEFAIIHHNYNDISQFIERMNRYTSIQAHEQYQNVNQASKINPWQAFADEFVSRYFYLKGHEDKTHGVFLAFLQSMSEVVVKAKIWEKSGFPDNLSEDEQQKQLDYLLKVLSFWRADLKIASSGGIARLYWKIRKKLYL